jgi:NAD(P)-dependent dehydrogenase (short-subunit alcohol dehydrogenase family)
LNTLAGQVAWITGSAQGIGATLAQAFAEAGASVVVSDLRAPDAAVDAIRASGGKAIGVVADVTNQASLESLVSQAEKAFGPITILVNNAGLFGTLELKPFMQITEDEWDAVFRVNTRGVFQATKAAVPSMRKAGAGSIINMCSGTILRGAPMFLHYVGSKGALFAMTRSMATELAADHIRVNSIIAGFTASQSVLDHPTMMARIRDRTLEARMIKRDMVPADISGAALFLASAASGFITGQAINVDGGAVTY